MATLSRNAQVLKFFAQQCRGLERTKLQKLAYLADLESRKLLGKPITDFRYQWYNHGPFDRAIYDAIDELIQHGFAETDEVHYPNGFVGHRIFDTGHPVAFAFSPAQTQILAYVAKEYTQTSLRELLEDVVYVSEPMQAVERRGQPLPMDSVDNQAKQEIGFDLEEVLANEREAEAGNYVPAADFFDGLRASLTPRDSWPNHGRDWKF